MQCILDQVHLFCDFQPSTYSADAATVSYVPSRLTDDSSAACSSSFFSLPRPTAEPLLHVRVATKQHVSKATSRSYHCHNFMMTLPRVEFEAQRPLTVLLVSRAVFYAVRSQTLNSRRLAPRSRKVFQRRLQSYRCCRSSA